MTRACVVGGGPAGLVAAKTLAGAGVDVDCYEMSSAVGGHWVLDNPNGRSAAYASLQTNTTPAMSRLSDFEMPSEWTDFPTHEKVREWFESYVDAFGFRDRIQLGSEVLSATALEPRGFCVEVRDAAGEVEHEDYDAVLACTGSYWARRMPELPGDFDGELMHAQDYRSPERPVPLAGKRVVVVGVGNTGCELACEIAAAGAEAVFLSARSGTWIIPKTIGGRPAAAAAPMMHPLDPVPSFLRFLPDALRQRLFARLGERMFHRLFGERMQRLQALGMPAPPQSPLVKRTTVCDPLLDSLESGAVVARPGIERLDGKEVVFADGSRERVDVVLCATGYSLEYPYLENELIDTSDDDLTLFYGTMHPRRHDLFIVGVSRPTGAFWPIAEVHAQLAAALLSGRYALPRQKEVERRARSILRSESFNPALFGLSMREELRRGARRAARSD